jgi:hypothetical protein
VKQRHVVLAALVLLALLIRLGFFLSSPNPYENAGLVAEHGEVARNIISHGKWFVVNRKALSEVAARRQLEHQLIDPDDVDFSKVDAHPEYQPEVLQTPGVALVLAALWAGTSDQDYAYVQVLEILLDSSMVLLVYWSSLRLFGRPRAALIASGIYAVFLPLAALTNIAHLDTWATYFVITIFCLFLKARDASPRWPWLIALGAATGVGAYFRPFILVLPLALAIASGLGSGWRRAWSLGVVPVVIALGFATPWTIRNYVEFHKFIPMRIGIGQNLWEGLGELSNNFGAVLDDQITAKQVADDRPRLHYGTPAYDAYLFGKARRAIEHHPGFYTKVVARRMALMTILLRNYNWLGQSQSPATYAEETGKGTPSYIIEKPWDAAKFGVSYFGEPLLFFFAITTAVATWRKLWRRHVVLLTVPLAVIAPYVVLHVEPRYALPGSFAYMILVGLGVDLAFSWLVARRAGVSAKDNLTTHSGLGDNESTGLEEPNQTHIRFVPKARLT